MSHKQIERDLFAESPIVHPTFFATRELFNKIGGYSNNPWAEDYDFILRAYGGGAKLAKHPEILVRKYFAPGRLSRVEAMYKRPAMFDAKAHYLLEFGRLNKRRGVLIVGSGPTGRQAAQSFENRGVRLLGSGLPPASLSPCSASSTDAVLAHASTVQYSTVQYSYRVW